MTTSAASWSSPAHDRAERAGAFEVWAARAWNVFNEGRPFSLVYPAMVLLAAAPSGSRPTAARPGAGRGARPRRGARRASRSRSAAGRCCGSRRGRRVPLLEPWRAPALLARRARRLRLLHRLLLGHASTTTCAPARRGPTSRRFWRLVADQLGPDQRQRARAGAEARDGARAAGRCWRRSPARAARARIAAVALIAAALGALAWRRFARDRLPGLPGAPRREPARAPRPARSRGAST